MGGDKTRLTSVYNAMAIEAVWGKCLLQSSVYPQQLTSVLCLPPTADLCPLFISSSWPLSSVCLQQLTSILCLSSTADCHRMFFPSSWLLSSVCPKQLTFVCLSSTANFHLFFIPNSWLQSVLCLSPTTEFCSLFILNSWLMSSVYPQQLTSVPCLSPTADLCLLILISWLSLLILDSWLMSVYPQWLTYVCLSSTADLSLFILNSWLSLFILNSYTRQWGQDGQADPGGLGAALRSPAQDAGGDHPGTAQPAAAGDAAGDAAHQQRWSWRRAGASVQRLGHAVHHPHLPDHPPVDLPMRMTRWGGDLLLADRGAFSPCVCVRDVCTQQSSCWCWMDLRPVIHKLQVWDVAKVCLCLCSTTHVGLVAAKDGCYWSWPVLGDW